MDNNLGAIRVKYLGDNENQIQVTIPGSCKLNSSNRQYHQSSKCDKVIISQEHCKKFDLRVNNTGRRISFNQSTYAYEGYAHLSCVFPEGGTVEANPVFQNCD